MHRTARIGFTLLALALAAATGAGAQSQIQVYNSCGQAQTVNLPPMTDLDQDRLSDDVEAMLLANFAPPIFQASDDACPSGVPASGTPDGRPNLVTCRLTYYPSQWIPTGGWAVTNPTLITPQVGFSWYYGRMVFACAVLYGNDCGCVFSHHTADVEPFFLSLSYGGGLPEGARYDANPASWGGGWIETIAHEGTVAERREEGPYSPAGGGSYAWLLSAADKHGNFLTDSRCDSTVYYWPSCSDRCSMDQAKNLLYVNVGEPNAPRVTNLGQFRSDYNGENPWGTQGFLASYGGGAGPIRNKMTFERTSVRQIGTGAMTCAGMCDWHLSCHGCNGYNNDAYQTYFNCLNGCNNGYPPTYTCPAPQPPPQVTTLSPAGVAAGAGSFTLTVNGAGFRNGCVVKIDGLSQYATFVSASQVTATVPPEMIATEGSRQVAVLNPDNQLSNAVSLVVSPPGQANPFPTVYGINPDRVYAGSPQLTVTVSGDGFVASSTVKLSGNSRPTSYVSPNELQTTVYASDITAVGSRTIKVKNPDPGGGTSGGVTLWIDANPFPAITSLSPSAVTAGSGDFTLTVDGTGFTPTSVVKVNGGSRPTVYVSATRLQATVYAGDVTVAGSANIKVKNPSPGGGLSSGVPLAVQ